MNPLAAIRRWGTPQPVRYWHDDEASHPPPGTWMWHLHHETLAEPLVPNLQQDRDDPLAARLRYIREVKSADEVPIRLALIHLVDTSLLDPKAYTAWAEARAARAEADVAREVTWAACQATTGVALRGGRLDLDAAWTVWIKADEAYVESVAALQPSLAAIHATSCPGLSGVGTCPWDGSSIFASGWAQ